MVISDEQVKEILKKEVMEVEDVLQLITNYIWEKKNYHIEKINNPGDNRMRLVLMAQAQNVVCDYYTKKLMNNES